MIQGEETRLRFQGPDERRARLERVKAKLAVHGVSIPPGRLARFETLSEGFAAKRVSARDSSRELHELLEGNRDFGDFATIVENLLPEQPPANRVVLEKLRDVLGGAPLPSEDTNPHARNTQFELYVAALCARGGLTPHFVEPDCIVTAAGLRLGLAAKRAGGAGHVRRLVKDGARQLRQAGVVGVVALSFDLLFAPNDERLVAESAEGLKPAAPEIIESTVRPHFAALDRDAAGSPTLAVLASVVVASAVPRENAIGRLTALFLHQLQRRLTRAQREALVVLHEAMKRPPPV